MRITIDILDGIFVRPKTEEQVAEEMLFAAANLWLARGEISREAYYDIVGPRGAPPDEDLMARFLSSPNPFEDPSPKS